MCGPVGVNPWLMSLVAERTLGGEEPLRYHQNPREARFASLGICFLTGQRQSRCQSQRVYTYMASHVRPSVLQFVELSPVSRIKVILQSVLYLNMIPAEFELHVSTPKQYWHKISNVIFIYTNFMITYHFTYHTAHLYSGDYDRGAVTGEYVLRPPAMAIHSIPIYGPTRTLCTWTRTPCDPTYQPEAYEPLQAFPNDQTAALRHARTFALA